MTVMRLTHLALQISHDTVSCDLTETSVRDMYTIRFSYVLQAVTMQLSPPPGRTRVGPYVGHGQLPDIVWFENRQLG